MRIGNQYDPMHMRLGAAASAYGVTISTGSGGSASAPARVTASRCPAAVLAAR
jgi:hypothetical protein